MGGRMAGVKDHAYLQGKKLLRRKDLSGGGNISA